MELTAKMQAELEELRDAAWQILDDFDKDGLCVCLHAKAMLRIAYEPFRDADEEMAFSLEEAKAIDARN